MHRNTLLFVSSLAVIAAFLVGTLVGRNLPRSTTLTVAPAPSPSAQPTPLVIPQRTYTDITCGLTLEYPNTFAVLDSTNSGTLLSDPQNESNNVLIICQKDIPRVPLPSSKITSVTLYTAKDTTVSAKIYHDAAASDGTPMDKLIFTHPNSGMDVLIGGFGATYNKIISSVELQ